MDQLKIALEVLKKYHFWVICAAVMVATLVCWWFAKTSLAAKFTTRKDEIERRFAGVITIEPHPPNQGVIDEIGKRTTTLRQGVDRAWQTFYSEQKEKNRLPAVLGNEFQKRYERLKPGAELPITYREIYAKKIGTYLPSLLELVDAIRPAGGAAANTNASAPSKGGLAPTAAVRQESKSIGVVNWDMADYNRITAPYDWQDPPSTFEIEVAQEDLWVYEALLRVIKNVNEGATNSANAAVKEIKTIEIGQPALIAEQNSEGTVINVGVSATHVVAQQGKGRQPGSVRSAKKDLEEDDSPKGRHGSATSRLRTGMTREQIIQQLMTNRYVDDNGTPVPPQDQYPYAAHPYAEFKMMPIHMNLMIREQQIPKLLAACANSTMPIEVRRVRILKTPSVPVDAKSLNTSQQASGAAASGRGKRGDDEDAKGGRGADFGGGAAAGPQAAQSQGSTQSIVPVDILGIISIYRPPPRSKSDAGAPPAASSAKTTASGETKSEAATPAAPTASPDTGSAVPATASEPPAASTPALEPATTASPTTTGAAASAAPSTSP